VVDTAVFTWRDGALVASTAPAPLELSTADAQPAYEQLSRTLRAHLAGTPGADKSVLLYGDTSVASDIAWRALAATGGRAVVLPRGEIKSLPAICDALRAQPRTPFVIIAELLSMVQFGEAYLALYTALELNLLPLNVMLLATARDKGMLRPGEADKEDGALTKLFDERLSTSA
jgi:predicted AAA+ superfamily ATPase